MSNSELKSYNYEIDSEKYDIERWKNGIVKIMS